MSPSSAPVITSITTVPVSPRLSQQHCEIRTLVISIFLIDKETESQSQLIWEDHQLPSGGKSMGGWWGEGERQS